MKKKKRKGKKHEALAGKLREGAGRTIACKYLIPQQTTQKGEKGWKKKGGRKNA